MNKDKFLLRLNEYKSIAKEYIKKIEIILKQENINKEFIDLFNTSLSFSNKTGKYINDININEKYKMLKPFIFFLKDNIELINYLLENKNFTETEIKLLIKNIIKDIKKVRRTKNKIEKRYEEDDDDEFFKFAAWFL